MCGVYIAALGPCFSKIQIGFTFLVPAHLGSPGQKAVKRVCVCVCVYWAQKYYNTCNTAMLTTLLIAYNVVKMETVRAPLTLFGGVWCK